MLFQQVQNAWRPSTDHIGNDNHNEVEDGLEREIRVTVEQPDLREFTAALRDFTASLGECTCSLKEATLQLKQASVDVRQSSQTGKRCEK